MYITPSENASLAKDLLKTFAISTATSVGILGGMVVVGIALEARERHQTKKTFNDIVSQNEHGL